MIKIDIKNKDKSKKDLEETKEDKLNYDKKFDKKWAEVFGADWGTKSRVLTVDEFMRE